MILSLTISRASLDLDDLVIRNFLGDGDRLLLSEQGFALPTFPLRYSYAPDSDYIPGKELLGAVQDQGTLPLAIHAFGVSIADLFAAKAELEAAVLQVEYSASAALDGTTVGTWDAFPVTPSWGDDLDSGLAAQFQARASLQLLLNPPT